MRNHKIREIHWVTADDFTCILMPEPNRYIANPEPLAGYGWSKGAGFYIYTIGSGHISKLGTVDRDYVLNNFGVDRPAEVV